MVPVAAPAAGARLTNPTTVARAAKNAAALRAYLRGTRRSICALQLRLRTIATPPVVPGGARCRRDAGTVSRYAASGRGHGRIRITPGAVPVVYPILLAVRLARHPHPA